jgi:hypothetical protein
LETNFAHAVDPRYEADVGDSDSTRVISDVGLCLSAVGFPTIYGPAGKRDDHYIFLFEQNNPTLEKSETYSVFTADCVLHLLYLHTTAKKFVRHRTYVCFLFCVVQISVKYETYRSSVGIATRYGLDGRSSIFGRGKRIFSSR